MMMRDKLKSIKTIGFSLLFFGVLVQVVYILSCDAQPTIEASDTSITTPAAVTTPIESSLRDSVVDYAKTLLGTPYVSAGTSPEGFDCSGFVYYVFQIFNTAVPRSSSGYASFGTEVSLDEVQKGDVLVFQSPTRDAIGHVGIVTVAAGMETEFIHGTSGKAMQVVISSLKNTGYKKRFIKAVRVLAD